MMCGDEVNMKKILSFKNGLKYKKVTMNGDVRCRNLLSQRCFCCETMLLLRTTIIFLSSTAVAMKAIHRHHHHATAAAIAAVASALAIHLLLCGNIIAPCQSFTPSRATRRAGVVASTPLLPFSSISLPPRCSRHPYHGLASRLGDVMDDELGKRKSFIMGGGFDEIMDDEDMLDDDDDDDKIDDYSDEELLAMAGDWDETIPQFNTIHLSGRVGNDPEARTLDDGKVVVNLSLAVTRKLHSQERKAMNVKYGDEETDWYALEVWGQSAEFVRKFVDKGMRVGVIGSLETDTWQDKTTGERRIKPRVLVRDFNILETRAEGEARRRQSGGSGSGTGRSAAGNNNSGRGRSFYKGDNSKDDNDDDDYYGGPVSAGSGFF
jgi:single-strand DNA-binding protein